MKKMTGVVLIFMCCMLCINGTISAQGIIKTGSNVMATPIEELRKTVVFIGRLNVSDGRPEIFATGFLVNVQNTFHLITAKHVIINPQTGALQDSDVLVFFNLRSGGVTIRSISEIKKEFGVDWVFHPDPKVDIAIIPFLVNPAEDDVRVISDSLFLESDQLHELYDVFFLSYQPGIDPKGRIKPIVRNGVISLMNDDRTFYIDATVFPGNSGSPVFVKPSPIRLGQSGYTIGNDTIGGRFIGIIGDYLCRQELAVSAQTGRPRIVFEENTGLSKVWSVTMIREVIGSEAFEKQLKKIRGK